MDGAGATVMYGYSPAVDLFAYADKLDENPKNVLLLGASDLRHVLKTLGFFKRHASSPSHKGSINFYMHDRSIETSARHLLLLSVLLDTSMNIDERIHTFLEIYGNSSIRERTAKYMIAKCTELLEFTGRDEGPMKQYFSLSLMKFREKDDLEEVIRGWRDDIKAFLSPSAPNKINIELLRDQRLRQYYTERYDVRKNLIDWDYSMKLAEMDVSIIHSHHFRQWRQLGLAFELRECTYPCPNSTLLSTVDGRLANGVRTRKRGFWCDIVNSPFISMGIESENAKLFEKASMQHKKTAVDVAIHNLYAFLHEWETGQRFSGFGEEDDNVLKPTQVIRPEEVVREEVSGNPRPPSSSSAAASSSEVPEAALKDLAVSESAAFTPLTQMKIFLFVGDPMATLRKAKYQNFFDAVSVSNYSVHLVRPDLGRSIREGAPVWIETARFMLDLRNDQKQDYLFKVNRLGRYCGFKPTQKIKDLEAVASKEAVLEATVKKLSFLTYRAPPASYYDTIPAPSAASAASASGEAPVSASSGEEAASIIGGGSDPKIQELAS